MHMHVNFMILISLLVSTTKRFLLRKFPVVRYIMCVCVMIYEKERYSYRPTQQVLGVVVFASMPCTIITIVCRYFLISDTPPVHSPVDKSPASPQSPEKSTQSQSMMKIECCIPIPIVCIHGYYNYHVNLGR